MEEEAQAAGRLGVRSSHPGTEEVVQRRILSAILGSEDESLGLGSCPFWAEPGNPLVWLMPCQVVTPFQGMGHCPNQASF